jgi:hypothetical protein
MSSLEIHIEPFISLGHQFALAAALICLTIVAHAFVLDRLLRALERIAPPLHKKLGRMAKVLLTSLSVLWVFFALGLYIWVWAGLYLYVQALPDLESALYFSTVAFTTVGFGDVVLPREWRLLSAFQAANGFILFGWSTAFIFEIISKLYEHERLNRKRTTA